MRVCVRAGMLTARTTATMSRGIALRDGGLQDGRSITGVDDLDLKECRPLLAGDEKAVVPGVVGDAVEDGLGGEALGGGKEAGAHATPV